MRQAIWEKNDCSRKKRAICGHENPGWPSLQRWIDRNLWDPLWKMRRAFFRELRQAAKIDKNYHLYTILFLFGRIGGLIYPLLFCQK